MKRRFKVTNIPLRKLVYALFFSSISLSWMGCEKDYFYVAPPPDPTAPVDSVYFKTEIFPIFVASCNAAPCHLNNANSPDLTNATIAYEQMWVNDAGNVLVDTSNGGANAANSILYKRMISSSSNKMPPSGILPSSQTSLILNWIKQGARNN